MTLRYLDVCSGYSAFSVGSTGLDVECVGYAEIDAFPAALLGHHYGASRARYMPDPDVPDLPAKERTSRIALRKAMTSLPDSQFGNRVTNFGDFTQIREDDVRGPVHLLTGGTPCQAFSVAGKRLGLDDPRGNLTLEFLALARRVRAEWLVWENVPGILSHDRGRTMGTFLRLLGECGYGWAYRVLDAQYIRVDRHERAVPQRRRRVILVAHLGDAAGPAAVLFERESLRGDPAPRREAGEGVARPLAAGTDRSGGYRNDADTADNLVAAFGGGNRSGAIDAAACLTAKGQKCDFEVETFIAETAGTLPAGGNATGGNRQPGTGAETAGTMLEPVAHALRAEGFGASEDGTGRGTPIVPVYAIHSDAFDRSGEGAGGTAAERSGLGVQADVAYSMRAKRPDAVAFSLRGREGEPQAEAAPAGLAPALRTTGGGSSHAFVATGWAVRRLTPRECERLMGVPDDFTAITYRGKPAADGPRYKALGNSQGANKMRWLARGLLDVIAAQESAA